MARTACPAICFRFPTEGSLGRQRPPDRRGAALEKFGLADDADEIHRVYYFRILGKKAVLCGVDEDADVPKDAIQYIGV